MSRLGKKPLHIPEGVTCVREDRTLKIAGPKGRRDLPVPPEVVCDIKNDVLSFSLGGDTRQGRANWGLVWSLARGALEGVSRGVEVKMKMEGVGYRVALEGRTLRLQLGFSHDVLYALPEGINVDVASPTRFSVVGGCPQRVGQTVSNLQAYRPPEPYKGKGVHRLGQYVRRKDGKKK